MPADMRLSGPRISRRDAPVRASRAGTEYRYAVKRPGGARPVRPRLGSMAALCRATRTRAAMACAICEPVRLSGELKMPRPSRRPPGRRDNSNGPSQRQLRVGEMLRHALSDILRENEIRDSELEGVSVTITQVKPSPDMRYATVFCEPLGGKNAKAIVGHIARERNPRQRVGRRVGD